MPMWDGTTKAIKDVELGDAVVGWYIDGMIDEIEPGWEEWTGPVGSEENKVKVHVVWTKSDFYSHYFLINNDVKITPSHPMLINQKDTDVWSWVDAGFLKVGDKMKGIDGTAIEITSIEKINEMVEVVELDVEEIDTYFVGETPIAVHNCIGFAKAF